jgi:hypothetical protein
MVCRYLNTGDAKLTSNLCKHAKVCWGEEAVAAADNTKDVHAAREALSKIRLVDGSITAAFERVAKSKVTYSHRQHFFLVCIYSTRERGPIVDFDLIQHCISKGLRALTYFPRLSHASPEACPERSLPMRPNWGSAQLFFDTPFVGLG